MGETWYFLCILPSPWPRTSQSPPRRIPPCSWGSPSPARPGCLAACPSLSLQLQSPLVHAVAEERGLQRFMKESQPGTFFLVHSALVSAHARSCTRPLDNLGRPPPPPVFSGTGARTHGGRSGGLFAVSSLNLKSRVHPVTMAQDGSSVNGEVSPLWGPFPPGSGRGPLAWFWHRQRPGHACPRTICGAQAQSTSSGTHGCPRVSRTQAAKCAGHSKVHGSRPPAGGACGQTARACAQRCVCPNLCVPAKGSGPVERRGITYDKQKEGTPGAQGWDQGGRQ